jgi:hypothetical protein
LAVGSRPYLLNWEASDELIKAVESFPAQRS